MPTIRRTFTGYSALSGKTAFTSPANMQKTDTTTTTYASGSVANNAQPGNRFNFSSDSFLPPSGLVSEINSVTIYTARYVANTSNAGFNVLGYFNNSSVSFLSNKVGGTANSYIQELVNIPSNYWNSNSISIDVQFQRNGGNGIAVRVPYLFIEVDYSEQVNVTGVSVVPESLDLDINSSYQMTATVTPSNASNKTVTWSSSNPSIASISSTGLVTALARGTVTITCTTNEGSFTDTSTVNSIGLPIPQRAQNVLNGTIPVLGIYNGIITVKAVYSGTQLIYPIVESGYVILTDDTRIEFSSNNTPFSNFETFDSDSKITINGVKINPEDEIKEIVFDSTYNNVTTINSYCWYYYNIEHFDMSNLTGLTEIGDDFLNYVEKNAEIIFPNAPNLKIVGDYFIAFSEGINEGDGIQSIDISMLTYLEEIGYGFLAYNPFLETIITPDFLNIQIIRGSFLGWNYKLKDINLSFLSNVEKIESAFLSSCTSLTSLDLSPLSNVTSIGTYFLNGCSGLTSLDISPLSNVTSIGSYFLEDCSGLTELHCGDFDASKPGISSTSFLNGLTNVSTSTRYHSSQDLADKFLAKAAPNSIQLWGVVVKHQLEDYSYFIDTNNVRHNFELVNTPIANFSNTVTGGSIIINGVSVPVNNIKQIVFGRTYLSVRTIPDNFLRSFVNLIKINLYGLSNIESIGAYFLRNCTSLTSLDLSPLSNIESIGIYFLYYCTSLTSLDCGNFDASKSDIIPTNFLRGLTNSSTSIRYHTTQQLADAMLAKAYANSIQNWQVVITG